MKLLTGIHKTKGKVYIFTYKDGKFLVSKKKDKTGMFSCDAELLNDIKYEKYSSD